jgi:hypothetical protein
VEAATGAHAGATLDGSAVVAITLTCERQMADPLFGKGATAVGELVIDTALAKLLMHFSTAHHQHPPAARQII